MKLKFAENSVKQSEAASKNMSQTILLTTVHCIFHVILVQMNINNIASCEQVFVYKLLRILVKERYIVMI